MCLFPVSVVKLFLGLGLEAFQGRCDWKGCAVAALGGVTYGSTGCADAPLRNMEYLSVSAVTAAGGFALTASHLEKPQVTKGSCPWRSVPRCGSACPLSSPAPWASTRPLDGARKSKAKARRPDSRPDCRLVPDSIVGASLLAINVQTTRSSRQHALSLTSIASRLAPTGDQVQP